MPLYEYRCRKCNAASEKIQKFSDPPLTTCEKCGGKLERLLSAPAIQFKGSGWYVTDYSRKPAAGSGKSETSSAGSEKKTGESASEAKKTRESSAAKDPSSTKPVADK